MVSFKYEQKINSGDLIAIAEMVRDLYGTMNRGSSRVQSGSFMKQLWNG